MKSTLAAAVRAIRRLRATDTGRLRGIDLLDRRPGLVTGQGHLPSPWSDRLAAATAGWTTGAVDAGTAVYVVCSDGVPVTWLTVHAAVVTPDFPLSGLQARHQRLATEALSDLTRPALLGLANLRDHREGLPDNVEAEYLPDMHGALRVAAPSDPTRTTWLHIGPDLAEATAQVRDSTGAPDPPLIITARGYGRHGTNAHRLSLELLCAMHAIAAEHDVTTGLVGDWIDNAHGGDGDASPATLPRRFRDTYLGRYPSRDAYAEQRMSEHGWTEVLRDTGMTPFFGQSHFTSHLFSTDVLGLDITHQTHPGGAVEVFHRSDGKRR